MGADGDEQRLTDALVEELMRKSSLCWLRLGGDDRERPVWHVWHEGAAYVVSGGDEQPLPGIESVDTATVIARTKDSRQRMVAWQARVSTIRPEDERWTHVVGVLVPARLNLRDMAGAAERWARDSVVSELRPTGVVQERPGTMPDDELAAQPVPTPATTRGALPRVLHRRQRRGPELR